MFMRKKLVYNTLLLTGTSLLMSFIGMAFQVWLVGRIGAAGMGLYQLVLSVTNLTATFAISGIRFAATRLISEELGVDNQGGIKGAMSRCLGYGLFFGTAAALILYYLAEPIGFLCIGDARTVKSLKISALSMPCISVCACISGYFTACGRILKPSVVHLTEQLAGFVLVAFFLSLAPYGDIEASCAAVSFGRMAADILSLLLMTLIYTLDRRLHYESSCSSFRPTVRILKIALPLAVSAYARSTLSTLQHLFVPKGLKAAGYSSNGALSGYGTIQGMALPLIFFPSCVISAAAELIVPELTEAQMKNERSVIRAMTARLIGTSLKFSVIVCIILFVFSDELSYSIYKSAEAGYFIRLLAPLVPIMYTDMCLDGCLKGLGQQVWCMGINIADAMCGLLLVIWLLPIYGLRAYIATIYLTELLNFVLSGRRLHRVLSRQSSPHGA